ncbi:hypothetical protein DFH07DRAFT_952217 [Mycena maculata]|uniref:Transmembrane protein n=1 Tax=Mycena maculata TaxID=230809 RepID=A0AAD7JYG3_9AGAR|nr:hypothetical protein DFH07DRAFT_952217 [Mycena maculata]
MLRRPFTRTVARSRAARRRFSALPKLKSAPADEILNLLETTASFVPQVLADDPSELKLWNGIFSTLIADIRSPYPRPVRLVVYGSKTSGARDLVTALLEEPFTSDPQHARNLRGRAGMSPEQTSLTIEYGSLAAEGSLRLPLTFLDQFPVPVQVIEAVDPSDLQTADVPVLVSRLEELHILRITRPDSLVAINIEPTETQPRASTSRSTVAPARYLYVSPSQALVALDALRESSPESPEAVQRYQTAFLASRVPTLTQTLHAILASLENTAMLRNRTALAQIQSALAACRAAIQESRAELDRIAAGVSNLDACVEEERAKVNREVFGSPDDHAVDRALADASSMLENKLGEMKWHRMMWHIDEMTTYMAQTVRRVWCVGLATQLTFHSGRLHRMQREFTDRGFALLAPSNTRALYSPVLHNTLRQLAAAPTFPIEASTLLDPLDARGNQILESPTARMHVAGQRALFGMGGAIATGMAISWAGWIGQLLNADGILAYAIDPATGMATGTLLCLSGIYWSSRRWTRARKDWWADFLRVSGGLKQDITEVLQHTMDNQVLVVARTGCAQLSKKLGERKSELDRLQEQLDTLSTAAEQLEQRK